MSKFPTILLSLLTACSLLLLGCNDTRISVDPTYKLSFSQDTLSFDTIFSTIGSSTQTFLIYNRNKQPLSISRITLASKSASGFSLNIDGTNLHNNDLSDIKIGANDSLFVFVNVTINPTLQNNPLLVRDSVIFVTNGNVQTVQLTAYGQDVTIFKSKTIRNDTLLSATKPYLIYNYLTIDKGKTLTIAPGAKLYFHNGAALNVNGSLKAEGTLEQRITFRNDRLDKLFEDVPYSYLSGTWEGIRFVGAQVTGSFNYTDIMGSRIGITATEGTLDKRPTLYINNSRIQNCDSTGVLTCNSDLSLFNSEISNCRNSCLSVLGGNISIIQSTIANYYNDYFTNKRRDGSPAVAISNWHNTPSSRAIAPLNIQFINTVIAGSTSSELSLADSTKIPKPQWLFDHCYITSQSVSSPSFINTIWGSPKDQLFISTSILQGKYIDFRPDDKAIFLKKANPLYSSKADFAYDMNGVLRTQNGVTDIGAYQWRKP